MNNKFKLNVATRLMLLIKLPEQGSVVEMITKRNIRKKIDFSSEEMEELKINSNDGKITWYNEKEPIEVTFNTDEINLIKQIIKILDESGLVTDNILDFIEDIQNS